MSEPKNSTALYVRISEELKHELNIYCVKNKVSIRETITKLLEYFLINIEDRK